MHISRFNAAERAAAAARNAAAMLGNDRNSRAQFDDLVAIAAEVRFFACGVFDNDNDLRSGSITPEQHAEIRERLTLRLADYMTPKE